MIFIFIPGIGVFHLFLNKVLWVHTHIWGASWFGIPSPACPAKPCDTGHLGYWEPEGKQWQYHRSYAPNSLNFYLIVPWFLSGIVFYSLFSGIPWWLKIKCPVTPAKENCPPQAAVSTPFYFRPIGEPWDASGVSITPQGSKSKPLYYVGSVAGRRSVEKQLPPAWAWMLCLCLSRNLTEK